jgi:glutaredoxin
MKSVTIYTGPLCNFCDAAKRLLTRNNVEYKEINIATVDGAMDEMIKKPMEKEQYLKSFLMINTLVVMMM